ncbi:unnamed protein product, partial [Durusdinium trenchii]
MFAVCDEDGTWWTWAESEETENVAVEDDACRETVEDIDEKVLVLSGLLPCVDGWSDSDAVHGTAEDELEHEHGLVLLAVPCDEACCSAEHIGVNEDFWLLDSGASVNVITRQAVFADFAFLNSSMEWTVHDPSEDPPQSLKFLVLKEAYTGSIGACLCGHGLDVVGQLTSWLTEFGLKSKPGTIAIQLVTDAEAAVSSLIAGVSKDFIFSVKRAGPQSHESNGAAERAVRVIKESFKCLLMEFEQHFGLALVFDPTTIQHALNYVSMAHNNFAVVHGSKRVPDSLRQQNPQLPRFIPGAFLHPQFQSMGTVIIAKVRMGQELTMRKFDEAPESVVDKGPMPVRTENASDVEVQLE